MSPAVHPRGNIQLEGGKGQPKFEPRNKVRSEWYRKAAEMEDKWGGRVIAERERLDFQGRRMRRLDKAGSSVVPCAATTPSEITMRGLQRERTFTCEVSRNYVIHRYSQANELN